jgi:hypothetical protein
MFVKPNIIIWVSDLYTETIITKREIMEEWNI